MPSPQRRDVDFGKSSDKWTLESIGSGKFYIRNRDGEYLYNAGINNDWNYIYTWLDKNDEPGTWAIWELIESSSPGWYYIATRRSGELRYICGYRLPTMLDFGRKWQLRIVN
jgi:hypothetical protein